jgi:hypothetical protein
MADSNVRKKNKPDPADRTEHWPIEKLIPSKNNARNHPEEQIRQIGAAITEFGWTIPVLIDEAGEIIAGHGRVLAARRLGMKSVPVIIARGWSEEQKRVYRLADNKLGENAEWDKQLLQLEIGALKDLNINIGLTGFSENEITAMLAGLGSDLNLADPEHAPPLGETAVSRPGDLWMLGDHRVLCGDATNALDVQALFGGAKPNLMVTDPPYGVEYDPTWRHKFQLHLNRSPRVGKVANDDRDDWREAWALFPGAVAYVWHGALHVLQVGESLVAHDFTLRTQIVWAKERLVIGRGDYHWQHEVCWYAVRGTGLDRRSQTNIALEHQDRWPGCRDHPRDAEADRMHAAPDRKQFAPRRRRL